MPVVRHLLQRFFRRRTTTLADGNRVFGQLIGRCPVCGRALPSGPSFWAFATTISSSPRHAEVSRDVQAHEWTFAQADEWDPVKDSTQFTAIKCPNDPSLLGFVITMHGADLFSSSYVQSASVLREPDVSVLLQLADRHWQAFQAYFTFSDLRSFFERLHLLAANRSPTSGTSATPALPPLRPARIPRP
jgi:hypothetical protein